MHPQAFAFVQSVAMTRPTGLVLEIGGRNVNGSVRALFLGAPYLSIDAIAGPGVDIVADGSVFVPDVSPSCVVCCEVLEHTEKAPRICAQVLDILRPGGLFIVTAAGDGRAPHSAIDGGPVQAGEFYRNVSAGDLCEWLGGFSGVEIRTNTDAGDVYAVARKGAA